MISVLIANWNTRDFLRQCLNSIPDPDSTRIEIVVVDNASSDGSTEMIRKEFPAVKLIESQENLGFGRGTNLAAQFALGECLLLLNPDTILHPGALENMYAYLVNHLDAGGVGPCIVNPDGTLQESCSPQPTLPREAWRLFHLDTLHPYSRYSELELQKHLVNGEAITVDVLLGACILLRRQVVEKTGLFDEQFFVYSEEVDLCRRIRQADWKLVWLPTSQITHFGGQSTRQNADAMFLELYRNKVKYFRKHYGAVKTDLYKAILYAAALPRWVVGGLFASSRLGRAHSWGDVSRQYRKLISAIPTF